MAANQPAKPSRLALLSLLLISYGVCSAVSDESTDKLSLLDFKRAATKDPTGVLRSWNTSIPHCFWEGVNCSPKHPGRVTDLNISGLGLSGTISPSLGNLTFLETLDLSTNGFTGELPPLNRLRRLWILFLSENSLQGIIPDAFTNCSNLGLLDLSGNFLTGQIPLNVGLLSNLLQLDLSENRLSGGIPATLLNQTSLELLDLSTNMLGMALPSNIDTLQNLIWFELDHNNFEGHVPASLGNISGLARIGLSFNNFIGQLP